VPSGAPIKRCQPAMKVARRAKASGHCPSSSAHQWRLKSATARFTAASLPSNVPME